jgi:type VI secretion system secreted protein VgrG
MAGYTQDNRPIRVDTQLGRDVLLLDSFHGVESLSSPYAFHVDLLSEKAEIDAPAMLRTPMLITFEPPGGRGKPRYIHGLVRRFVQLGQHGTLTIYHAEVVPWLWFLSLGRGCRIFQDMGALDIVSTVLTETSTDFDIRCNRTPPTREYTVQYRETNLNFISRMLESEGIYYFFEHTDTKHTMVLTDDSRSAAAAPTKSARFHRQRVQDEDIVWSIEHEHAVHTGKVTLRDYDYLQPTLTLESTLAGEPPEEIYDYPGNFRSPGVGDFNARAILEAYEAGQRTLRGDSNCRGFVPGMKFELEDHYRSDTNGEYLLTRVQHFMKGSDYLARGQTASVEYHNDFMAIPASLPFRPQPRTPRPVIHGTQTALVVGPAGEEVHVDNHCRIKVQFYWDREGQKNESSSCWVRVASPWAGKLWGNVTIPRIGNEVVIEFLEGDPDRPLVIGSVYNADQVPPFALPDADIQMGAKSRSSPGGGGYNEITMTDTKGKELITIHGQYDMSTTIEHDDRVSIGNDQSTTIGNNQTISVGNNRTESVGKNETITIGEKRTESVGKDETVSVGGKRVVSIAKEETLDVGKDRTINVSGKETVSINGDRSTEIGGQDQLNVGKKLSVIANDEILLKTGSASIQMKKDGTITIKGKNITIQGSGSINVKASSNVVLKGSKITQN